MKVALINKERFKGIVKDLRANELIDIDYIYEVYETVSKAVEEVLTTTDYARFTPVNPIVIILYIVNEYIYTTSSLSKEQLKEFINDDNNFNLLCSLCADKYLTNEQLNYRSKAFLSRFNPPVSTLELYLNFALRTLESFKSVSKDEELIIDMLTKGFKLSKCIISLLIDGFETEAFSTWRTLHENESILLCLIKHGEEVFNEYFKHITYALAYRGQIRSKEETDKIFVQIKEEMKEHDLKSKDMKKFIEYGYLFKVKNVELNKDFKLNFRDGVEKLAGLSSYSKAYEMASEIAHSSPLLLYSRRDYFFNITLINLYESFFRLENIFYTLARVKSKENLTRYEAVRKVYLTQLISIKKRIDYSFIKNFNGKKNKENSEDLQGN